MVLYGIIGSLSQDFGHFGPFATIKYKHKVKEPFLTLSPLILIDGRIEMVMPSLTALFSASIGNKLGDKCPFFSAMLIDNFGEHLVLFVRPLPFSKH